jgi:CHAT domain-containing protein
MSAATVTTVTALIALRGPIRTVRVEIALHHTVNVMNAEPSLGAPLQNDSTPLIRSLSSLAFRPRNRYEAASGLLRSLGRNDGDRAESIRAVAHLAGGQTEAALRHFDAIPPQRRSAATWSNLAAAHLVASGAVDDHDHLLGALTSADRALAIDSQCATAWFVRATVLERMGLGSVAAVMWRPYLTQSESEPWATLARQHVDRLRNQVSDDAGWRQSLSRPATMTYHDLAALVRRYPEQARTFAESLYGSAWADAVRGGNDAAAAAELRRMRIIAESLQIQSGESLLLELVRSIETANPERRRALADAYLLYRDGRVVLRDGVPAKALPILSRAQQLFASISSPMAALTECYVAVALIEQNRSAEARRHLGAVIDLERLAQSNHYGLQAYAQYHLALIEAADGNWSDAIAAAEEAFSLSNRLGERGQAGLAATLISESYDFLGQTDIAWRRGLDAIAHLIAAGDRMRARIMISGLSHAEIRNEQWEFARALVGVERAMAIGAAMPRLDCDMLLRDAVAAHHLGQARMAERSIADARIAARATEASIRDKLLADVAAVEGSLLRRSSPNRSVSLLSEAISFQERAERFVLLPQLHLERGRASLAAGRLDQAEKDFVAGIRRLEQQRRHTTSAALRSGIFDDAGNLFREAVSLALRRNDAAAAFSYIERGRARTMFEEMPSRPPSVSIETLSTALPEDRLLIEYEVLEDEVAIFVVSRSGLSATRVHVPRSEIEREAADFLSAVMTRRPMSEVSVLAKKLYEWLLAPIAERLAQARTLVIVADSTLQQIPFAALIDPRSDRFVVQTHTVINVPSAAVYAVASSHDKQRPASPLTAAVFANPSLRGGAFESLAPLPASEFEGQRIAGLYARAVFVRDTDATPSTVASLGPSHDVVHFACHALVRPREPWHSALLLAPENDDGGLLSAGRISRMVFRRTHLVVLASCATEQRASDGVDGVPSVARAFLIAGVPAVIATLWDVEDGEVGSFVQALHTRFIGGAAPAEALRLAQLDALNGPSPERQHPGFWSVFALVGGSRGEGNGLDDLPPSIMRP